MNTEDKAASSGKLEIMEPIATPLQSMLPPSGQGAKEWCISVWNAWRKPFHSGLIAAFLTLLYTLSLPNQYKSEARVLPADSRGAGGGMAATAVAAAGISLPGSDGSDAAYVDILNSRSLREALLLSRFSYRIKTWYFGVEQTRSETLYKFLDKSNMDRAIVSLKDKIKISRDTKTKLLTITVETASADLSQHVAERLIELLNEFVVSKTQTRGGLKASFSAKRLGEVRSELAQAEEALRSFLDGNRNYLQSPDATVRLKGMRLENELKLRTQVLSTLAIGREQALLEEKNDMPILNVVDPGNLPIEKSGPLRSILVLLAFGLVVLGRGAWEYRERIQAALKDTDPAPGATNQQP